MKDLSTRSIPQRDPIRALATDAPNLKLIPSKLQSLQTLRAVAALLVVMYHTQGILGAARVNSSVFHGIFHDGDKGVDLFFVLSGFIITFIHFRDWGRADRIANYVFNRLSRVYPSVWIMTLLAIGVYASGFGGAEKIAKLAPWNVVASTLLLPQAGDALVNVSWTLKYEIFFYLMFIGFLLNARLGATLIVAWQSTIIVLAVSGISYLSFPGGFYFRPICLEFGMGILVALYVLRADVIHPRQAFIIFMFGIALFFGEAVRQTLDNTTSSGIRETFIFGTASALIVVSLVSLEHFRILPLPSLLVILGDASYAIYLVHWSVINLVVAAIRHFPILINDLTGILVAAFAVALGLCFDRFVDRPIQDALRKLKPMIIGARRSNQV